MFKNRFLLTVFVLLLGIAIVGVANAATIKYSTANQAPDQGNVSIQNQNAVQAAAPAPVTPDTVQQMIQACWQMDQAMIDQWLKATGLTREDLLKMEQAWMQGVLQQNPDLNVQAAYNMHQTWLQSTINSYRPINQQPQQQTTPQNQAPQNSAPKQNYQQYNNSPQYSGWYCPPGWGNNGRNGYGCW